jgi:hypothetical protein
MEVGFDEKYHDDLEKLVNADLFWQPLAVYNPDESYVKPADVKAVMANSLIEIHFSLKHWSINKQPDQYDSFNGYIEQIIIKEHGVPTASRAYKRTNPQEGPFHPRPAPFGSCDPKNKDGGLDGNKSSMANLASASGEEGSAVPENVAAAEKAKATTGLEADKAGLESGTNCGAVKKASQSKARQIV